MRRFLPIPIAIALVLSVAGPVLAYVLYGWFNTGAIDTNLDNEADISVCYDTQLAGAIYVNRSQIEQEIERWHEASVGDFSSNGICNDDGSLIQMLWANLGTCEPNDGFADILGATDDLGNTGYSQIDIVFNTECLDDFDWYDTDGIDAGKFSALAVALHEVGHALGLNHSADNRAVMYVTGPNGCSIVGNDWTLAADDANGYRTRYPGIDNTATTFPSQGACSP